MFSLKPMFLSLLVINTFAMSITYADTSLKSMTDEQLSETTGQALMSLSYIAPTDATNVEAQRLNGDKRIGFYKLGMEAELELNANIKKLQLGCGGVNGADKCDIDIDNLGLSGLRVDANGSPLPMTREERAGSSAKLTNPFIEFAIKNPNSASQREVVGLRLSAEKVVGLLTTGTNNDTPNGINSLSGYMTVNGFGNATTRQGVFGLNVGEVVKTVADLNIILCTSGCGSNKPLSAGYGAGSSGSNKGLTIPSMVAPFFVTNAVISGNRMTTANVKAEAMIPDIPITSASGQLGVSLDQSVCVAFLVCIQDTFIKLNTKIVNLKADISFSEGLGYIHNLPINSSAYLGLQQGELQWPGAKEVAQRGWWLSMQDPINLGDISPVDPIDISSVYPQFAKILGDKLAESQYKISVTTGDGLGALFGSGITKDLSPVNVIGQSVGIPLSNLKLSTQSVTPNCYGSLKFC